MMRGKIDLGNHKLAGLFRPPPAREPWKRARRGARYVRLASRISHASGAQRCRAQRGQARDGNYSWLRNASCAGSLCGIGGRTG